MVEANGPARACDRSRTVMSSKASTDYRLYMRFVLSERGEHLAGFRGEPAPCGFGGIEPRFGADPFEHFRRIEEASGREGARGAFQLLRFRANPFRVSGVDCRLQGLEAIGAFVEKQIDGR